MDYVAILKAYLHAVKDAEGVSFTEDADLPGDLGAELMRIEAEVDADRWSQAEAHRRKRLGLD